MCLILQLLQALCIGEPQVTVQAFIMVLENKTGLKQLLILHS